MLTTASLVAMRVGRPTADLDRIRSDRAGGRLAGLHRAGHVAVPAADQGAATLACRGGIGLRCAAVVRSDDRSPFATVDFTGDVEDPVTTVISTAEC
jgi:hypothetical protein